MPQVWAFSYAVNPFRKQTLSSVLGIQSGIVNLNSWMKVTLG